MRYPPVPAIVRRRPSLFSGRRSGLPTALLSLLVLLLLFPGCARKPVLTGPAKQPVPVPAKRIPEMAEIPPTQRPYRIMGRTYYPLPSSHGFIEEGIASWYGRKFHGRKTSNGETYNMYDVTAAHKTLPMNTYVLVENLENGREMAVRINDRGPFVKGRIIDLSLRAAQELGVVRKGTARVRISALGEAKTYVRGKKRIERFLPHEDFQQGEFYVQIGSFILRENALRLQKKLNDWGRKTVVVTFDQSDTLFYRVQVWGGTDLTAARHLERALNEAGFTDAFVVAH